jgi:endonuclease YncB( thermonuclease family)
MKTDRYARRVCRVYADNEDVSLAMLSAGAAWWFRRYAHEQSAAERRDYAAAEHHARSQAVGLWEAAAPVAPWIWRKTAKH